MSLAPTDPESGAWIEPRLTEFATYHLGAIVPRGFESYARILHPVKVGKESWITWAEVARRAGTELGPTSAWWRVAGAEHRTDHLEHCPDVGNLEERSFDALLENLLSESGADAECVVAVWHGFGHITGARSIFGWSQEAPLTPWQKWGPVRWLRGLMRLRSPHSFTRESPPGPYPPEVLDGPTLELPHREYFTFASTHATVHGPCRYDQWAEGDREGWQSPQLLWPLDRAWCVATEIDYDSTLVGGSAALIGRILADPRLEAFPVDPDDSIDHAEH